MSGSRTVALSCSPAMYMMALATLALAAVVVLAGCAPAATPTAPVETQPAAGEGIANPASENCVKQGGKSFIMDGPAGQYGICEFEDAMRCEEWAMMRGDCPVGGVKTTGYITDAAIYCAITGGDYEITANSGAEDEQGTCTFKTGKSCDVWKYYQGECTP